MEPTTVATGVGAGIGAGTAMAAIAKDAGKKLVGPLAEKLGLALADLGDIYRFYQNENLRKIFTKWAEARGDRPPLTEEEIRRTLPLLPLASVQCDEELQQRWAALLENAAAGTGSVFVSFGQTLSQITPDEARFLDRLLTLLTANAQPYDPHPERAGLSREVLLKTYDPELVGVYTRDPGLLAKLNHAEFVLQDLDRLGILSEDQVPLTDGYLTIPREVGNVRINHSIVGKKIALHRSEVQFKLKYSLSPYGVGFIRAVSPAKREG